jgi:subtilisin family serine protease
MIRILACISILALTVSACTGLVSDEAANLRMMNKQAGARILITLPDAPSQALGLVGAPGQNYLRRRGYGPSPTINRNLNRIAREYGLRRVRGWPIDSIGVYCEVYELEGGQDANELLARLADDPRIDVAQRMNVFETLGSRYDDPFADLQTSVTSLAVEGAHEFATGLGVKIAVIDSQVDNRHPELRGSIQHTRDLVDGGLVRTPELHGTAIAGVIASAANNTEGIVGVAPGAEILALRACWTIAPGTSGARCSSFSLAQALEVALQMEVQVINLSLAGPADPLLGKLLDEALARGVIVVAASADSTADPQNFPASHPGVIAAQSGIGTTGKIGPNVVNAPANEILTTTPDAGYAFFSGNSMAAAHVSGVAALLLERSPEMAGHEIAALLNATAIDHGESRSINACLAVARLMRIKACSEPRPTMAREAR